MRTLVRRVAVPLLALCAAPLAPDARAAAQPASAAPLPAPLPSVVLPPALDRVLRDYERAWTARDAAALAALFAEDGFVLQAGHPPVRGRVGIRAAYEGAGGPLRLRALAYAERGDVGYVIGGYGLPGAEEDGGKFVLTLRRERGGRWLIVSDMDNPNTRPAPRAPGT